MRVEGAVDVDTTRDLSYETKNNCKNLEAYRFISLCEVNVIF